jgi:hypothetical protein
MQDDVAIESVLRREVICNSCKQPGHFAKNCPEKFIEKAGTFIMNIYRDMGSS